VIVPARLVDDRDLCWLRSNSARLVDDRDNDKDPLKDKPNHVIESARLVDDRDDIQRINREVVRACDRTCSVG
jgi:hypothetical protein